MKEHSKRQSLPEKLKKSGNTWILDKLIKNETDVIICKASIDGILSALTMRLLLSKRWRELHPINNREKCPRVHIIPFFKKHSELSDALKPFMKRYENRPKQKIGLLLVNVSPLKQTVTQIKKLFDLERHNSRPFFLTIIDEHTKNHSNPRKESIEWEEALRNDPIFSRGNLVITNESLLVDKDNLFNSSGSIIKYVFSDYLNPKTKELTAAAEAADMGEHNTNPISDWVNKLIKVSSFLEIEKRGYFPFSKILKIIINYIQKERSIDNIRLGYRGDPATKKMLNEMIDIYDEGLRTIMELLDPEGKNPNYIKKLKCIVLYTGGMFMDNPRFLHSKGEVFKKYREQGVELSFIAAIRIPKIKLNLFDINLFFDESLDRYTINKSLEKKYENRRAEIAGTFVTYETRLLFGSNRSVIKIMLKREDRKEIPEDVIKEEIRELTETVSYYINQTT